VAVSVFDYFGVGNAFVYALFEFFLGFTERASELGKLGAAEKQDDDRKNDE